MGLGLLGWHTRACVLEPMCTAVQRCGVVHLGVVLIVLRMVLLAVVLRLEGLLLLALLMCKGLRVPHVLLAVVLALVLLVLLRGHVARHVLPVHVAHVLHAVRAHLLLPLAHWLLLNGWKVSVEGWGKGLGGPA